MHASNSYKHRGKLCDEQCAISDFGLGENRQFLLFPKAANHLFFQTGKPHTNTRQEIITLSSISFCGKFEF